MRTFAPGLTGLAQQHRLLPRSLALSERRTSTSSCSRMASRIMFPSLLNRKSMGILMSSVSFPSPAIWNRGAVSLLLPSLSSAQRTNTAVRASICQCGHAAAAAAFPTDSKEFMLQENIYNLQIN